MTTSLQGRIIKSNQSIFLDDPQTIWVVKSGQLVLHGVSIVGGSGAFADAIAFENGNRQELVSNRRFLFNIGVGEAMFGATLAPTAKSNEYRGILAVAIEETTLQKVSLPDLIAKVKTGNVKAIGLLEAWLCHLGAWSNAQPQLAAAPTNSIVAAGTHYLSSIEDQTFVPPRPSLNNQQASQTVAWVDVRQGIALWQGIPELTCDLDCPPMPLMFGTWLTATNAVEVYTSPTQELESIDTIPASLERLHAYFWHCFNLLEQHHTKSEFRRFQERQQLNRQTIESSMDELAGVLDTKDTEVLPIGSHLSIAAGAVGRAMGIKILPPPASEDSDRIKDPVETIARASQCRTRRVALTGEWWKHEHGALLAYTKADVPVALLPESGDRYIVFNPELSTKTRLNAKEIDNLKTEAYVFYRPLPPFVTNAVDIFLFGIKGYEKDIVAIFGLGILASLLGMVTPQATAILVNDAIPDSNRTLLTQLGLALFAAALGQATFQLAQQIISLRVESAADASLQPAVWDRILKLSPAFFRNYASGDLVNRLLAIGQIRAHLSGSTQRTLLNGVFALLNLGLMFAYSVQLALVGLGLSVLVVIVTIISSRMLVTKQRLQEQIDGDINGLTVELIEGVSKLRVAAAEERAFGSWAKKYSQRIKLESGIKYIDDSLSVFNEALPVVSSVLIFWFAILFIQIAAMENKPGGLSAGSFLAFNTAFTVFLTGVTEISNTLSNVLEIIPLWERAKPIIQTPLESDPSQADPGRLTGRIALEHVNFRYREDGPLILSDVSVYAEPGEFIAIVGPSGSGKSTVFRLLLGFELPASGTVSYDGQDLAGLDVQAVRRQLGVVLQNVRISAAPIFDSIAAGALITLEEAWEAARMAGFEADIKAMPMGMHTVISEGGTNLSGGQRQRLLIARSLVLKPKILLMDEATSALDNQTQTIVSESLDRMNATRIVIAHRLSTIRNADRIYVVEAGIVVQSGNFDELVNQEGLFARLVARQLD